MASQASLPRSMSNGSHSDMDDDEDMSNYYEDNDDAEMERKKEDDPEYFDFELLNVEGVERLLNESVEAVCKAINVGRIFLSLTIN